MKNKLNQSRLFLIAAILLIVAFQGYWINKLFQEEKFRLEKETNTIFRDVIYNLQVDRFKADTIFYQSQKSPNLFVFNAVNELIRKSASVRNNAKKKLKDTMASELRNEIIHKQIDSNRVEGQRIFQIQTAGSQKMEFDTGILNKMRRSGLNVVVRYVNKNPDSNLAMVNKGNAISIRMPSIPKDTVRRDTSANLITAKMDLKFDVQQPEKAIIRMIKDGKVLDDTFPKLQLDSAYKKELVKAGIPVSFHIQNISSDPNLKSKNDTVLSAFRTDKIPVGFKKSSWYQASFENPFSYILGKISPQILFSVFLIAFTSIAFLFIYRNLVAQRKLTEIKNEFISNVTHELKTPIATVTVAIEALRNFGGLQNPEKTKEYLDISASELQRLSLLVDKVLKLSLFENHEIELQKESFDLLSLVEDVMASMKLQFEKQKAHVTFNKSETSCIIHADKLHITSMIYNLLDNALKYSKENTEINVSLNKIDNAYKLEIQDNGIGIDMAYQTKIFEQFFRVPHGNVHNTKGYGLGLSYVNHIVKKHQGFIDVKSEPGQGSTFIVTLPLGFSDTV